MRRNYKQLFQRKKKIKTWLNPSFLLSYVYTHMNNINPETIKRRTPRYDEGLCEPEVSLRVREGLVNKTKPVYGKSYKEIILSNLFSFFNILLYIIAGFMIYAGKYSGLLFLFVLIPNILIGLIQDLRARYIIGKLRLTTMNPFMVVRDGKGVDVIPYDIVADDIVKISTSNQVPVDGEIVEGFCFVNESLLTGESVNIYKKVGDKVLSGSYVTSGTAYIHASNVGEDCYVEKIQNQANKFARSPSKILNSLRSLFKGIGIVVIIFAVVSVITYAVQGKFATPELVKDSIASIAGSMVSMIPSGLYLLTSVALAVGVISLYRKRTAVQEMYSIEMLARTDVLCLDKTGTITDGTLQVKLVVPFRNDLNQEQIKQIISNVVHATNDSNSTAIALKDYFNYSQTSVPTAIAPFSSDTKYSGATLRGKGTFIIGAIDFLNIRNKKGISYKIQEYTSKGYRVLVLGYTKEPIVNNRINAELEPICMIVLRDKVRDNAKETFKWFRENSVDIKVISGDDPLTVSEIAKEAGIEGFDKYISLAGKPLDEVKQIILHFDYRIFGRVTPEQKEVIVLTLKEQGKTVAMTGDGVNDILALKRADCSIAMNSGSEAAKNVSHIVLLDSDFSRLPDIVSEGRRVINNIQRTSSLFLIKTFFAMFMTLFFLVLSWINKDYSYPFLTNNMYCWELVTIGFATFFLALQPNKEIVTNKGFLKNIFANAIPAAISVVSMVVILFTFYFLGKYKLFYTGLDYRTVIVGGMEVDVALRQTISMSVFCFSLFSLLTLFKISLPPNKYRITVWVFALLIMIGFFVTDIIWNINTRDLVDGPNNILNISYQYLVPINYIVAFNVFAIISTLYFAITYIVKIIKRGAKHD